jgi:hypothetical protein
MVSGYEEDLGEFLSLFGPDEPPGLLAAAAVLFTRRWLLGQRIPWPSIFETDPLRVLLLLMAAARCGRGRGLHLAPDGSDLTRVQSAPLARARATLTAAPPARVPAPAGTTG